jgi:prepilin-type N-terminal cleavage/methylation domain-containing protein
MRLLRTGEDGFTLIELVMTMAILLVVVSALTGALISATNTEADQNNRFQSQTQARLALTKLTREIHCANTIQGLDSGGNAVTLTTTQQPGMVLTLPAGCPTGGATAVTAKWCAVQNGSLYDLYRTTGATCSAATGVRWGSGLVSGTPFSLPASTQSHALQLIHVNLTVNTRGSGTSVGIYTLNDDIAALNATRS